ncbi:MAG TPA: tetratricopeptide repeat protein [Bryobacteraceae bacterium]
MLIRNPKLLMASASLVLAVHVLPADIPASPWVPLRQQALAASATGSFNKAEELLHAAIVSLQGSSGQAKEAVGIWNQLGLVHQAEYKLEEAASNFQHALELNQLLTEPNTAQTASLLSNLGTISQSQGKFKEAEKYFRQSYALLEEKHLTETATAAPVLNNLALDLQQQGRYKEAEQFYSLAFAAFHRVQAENSPEFAKLLMNSGTFDFETGRPADALPKHRRVIQIQSTLPSVRDYDRGYALNNLGLTLFELNHLSEAESCFREALELEKHGPVHIKVVETLNSLSVLESKTGRLEAAKQHAQQALQLAEQNGERNDPVFATIWNNLGMIAVAQHDLREAKRMFEKAKERWIVTVGTNSPQYSATLSNLAGLESKHGRHKEARKMLSETLRIDQARWGPNHPQVAADLANLASQLFFLRDYAEAIDLYKRAERIQEARLGPEHSDAAGTWRNLAVTYELAKQYGDAETAYRSAIKGYESGSGSGSLELSKCLREYAALLRQLQRFSEAAEADVRASGIEVKTAIKAERAGLAFRD